jgi:low affinity Fe/Cu permease
MKSSIQPLGQGDVFEQNRVSGTGSIFPDLRNAPSTGQMAMSIPAISADGGPDGGTRRAARSGKVATGGLLSKSFSAFSHAVARATGAPAAFLIATFTIVAWAITGPIFGYSDTWQLVINTGTTIVTFLMVFLIQNTQNRDTMALQLKLSELIIAVKGAKDSVAVIENLSEEELEQLHDQLCSRMQMTKDVLSDRKRSKRVRRRKS